MLTRSRICSATGTSSTSSPPPVLASQGSSAAKKRLKSSSVVQPSSPLLMAHYASPPGSDIGGVKDDIKEDPFEVPFSVVMSSLRGRKPAGRGGVAKKSNLSEVSLSADAIVSAEK
ncbi:hypothetical protein CEUSTIGMA_g1920.t1 [Chlamydomonas eustigma]|uniref:Uncharacterized protein n=1 Tax=Chlamydomonas eustigma TaxID=1157962 RepID=A0A250WUI2_9CHLO|nr:hypothetical protein CEUSTIGMA_g1920.t1 [Chlamydomonas eustigma]|eukprot:GAX74471.1 hypothetical protein CEUSTIGMA_g1920.t1 [Chlamydomonas eustigma]